jgi:PAS domain S-box-containing protein
MSDKYERLRAWYLAHLRKSQLTGEFADGMTPATLIRRDREALELLIAEQDASLSPLSKSASGAIQKPLKLKPSNFLMVMNAVVAGWILFERSVDIELSVRMPIAILLLLSSLLLNATNRKLNSSEVTLLAVTQREKDIADYAFESFWSMDEDFKCAACNQAFEQLSGSPGYLLSGRSFLQLVTVGEQERLKEYFAQVKQSREVQKCETQLCRANGSHIDLELSAEYSSSDSTYYCLGIDITERKNVDRLKEQLMDMLSHDLKTRLFDVWRFTTGNSFRKRLPFNQLHADVRSSRPQQIAIVDHRYIGVIQARAALSLALKSQELALVDA